MKNVLKNIMETSEENRGFSVIRGIGGSDII